MKRTIITSDLYKQIKKVLKEPKDDEKVSKKFGISKRTAIYIRNSANFAEYKNKTSHGKTEIKDIESIDKMLDREMRRFKYLDEPKGNAIVTTLFVVVVAIFVIGTLIFLANR